MKGLLFDIQRFSLHDGPGIRTTVFLKACPLKCYWCQNPEGLAPGKQVLQFFKNRCIGCGECFRVCPVGAHKKVEYDHFIDRELCTNCGACSEVCPSKALVMSGTEMDTEEVVRRVAADKVFFDYSKGGVTLSGGDPLVQLDYSIDILSKCKEQGIGTAIETSLNFDWEVIEKILPVTDLVMCDIKHIDPAKHKIGTGASNEKILENVKKLSETGIPMIIRVPIVPGFNDSSDVISGIVSLIKGMKSVRYIELLEYHNLGEYKYDSLGQTCKAAGCGSVSKDKLRAFAAIAEKENVKVKAVL